VKWDKNECYMPQMIGARQYDPLDPVRVRVGVENQAL
jgi:hypothetical protein